VTPPALPGTLFLFGLQGPGQLPYVLEKYIARIYEEVKQRPHFIIQQTINIEKNEILNNDKEKEDK